MRRLAPAQDDVIVKLVRGLESATSADRDGSEVERGRRSSEEVEGLEAPSSRSSRPTLLSDENGAEAVGGGGESESETEIDGEVDDQEVLDAVEQGFGLPQGSFENK